MGIYKKLTILGLIVLGSGLFFYRVPLRLTLNDVFKEPLPEAMSLPTTVQPAEGKPIAVGEPNPSTPTPKPQTEPVPEAGIPATYNLAVPFQSQAPLGNWDQPYQDACEEASLIMANAFFARQDLSASQMDASIKQLVDWEVKTFGYYEDTSAAEVVRTAKEYFNLNAKLDTDVSVDHIKSLISQNKLVIIPAAGKILPNPNFKNGGPIYHMLVVRGYTQDKFITNDPGTRLGKEFLYTYSSLINAIHDWPEGSDKDSVTPAEMLKTRKVIIVVTK